MVLADLRRGWAPDEDMFQVGPFEYRLKFPVCKLIDHLDTDCRRLLAAGPAGPAEIDALRTAGDALGRYRAKRNLVLGSN